MLCVAGINEERRMAGVGTNLLVPLMYIGFASWNLNQQPPPHEQEA
jgi:hypothetical protein